MWQLVQCTSMADLTAKHLVQSQQAPPPLAHGLWAQPLSAIHGKQPTPSGHTCGPTTTSGPPPPLAVPCRPTHKQAQTCTIASVQPTWAGLAALVRPCPLAHPCPCMLPHGPAWVWARVGGLGPKCPQLGTCPNKPSCTRPQCMPRCGAVWGALCTRAATNPKGTPPVWGWAHGRPHLPTWGQGTCLCLPTLGQPWRRLGPCGALGAHMATCAATCCPFSRCGRAWQSGCHGRRNTCRSRRMML